MIGTPFPGFELLPPAAKAGLIIVHGIAEHGGRYRHVAEALASKGIACFVYDQRGHGEFPGTRTHVAEFAQFARDLELVGEAAQKRLPSLPLFVWGHSMGSIVAMLAAIDGLRWARGVITTGCALDAMPRLEGLGGAGLRIATASLRLLYGFAVACHKCHANAPKITLPWLAVHGEADRVCPVSGSRALIRALGSHDKQLVTYPGLLHEVHNEDSRSREALFDLMTRCILERYTVHPVL